MDGFFLPDVPDVARVLVLHGLGVENPPFYPMLAGMGFSNLPDFSPMAAITFSDVVVSHVPFTDGLLFHELVHVEQCRQLGFRRFSELYVRGFLASGGHGIPLEANAYALGRQFEGNPRLPPRRPKLSQGFAQIAQGHCKELSWCVVLACSLSGNSNGTTRLYLLLARQRVA